MAKKPSPLTSDLLVRKGEATPSSVNPADRSTDVGLTAATPQTGAQAVGGRPQTPEPEIVLAADEDTGTTHGSRRRLAAVLGLVAVVTATVLAINMFGSDGQQLSVAPVGTDEDVALIEAPSVAPVISAPTPESVGVPTAPAEPELRLSPVDTAPTTETEVASLPAPVAPVLPEPVIVEAAPIAPPREAATITPPQATAPVEAALPEAAAETLAAETLTAETLRASPAPTVATSGQYLVQVLSVRSESAARAAWSRMQATHGALLVNETLNMEQADLGERGIFYRVRFGAFDARSSANATCKALKSEGQDCLVKRVN